MHAWCATAYMVFMRNAIGSKPCVGIKVKYSPFVLSPLFRFWLGKLLIVLIPFLTSKFSLTRLWFDRHNLSNSGISSCYGADCQSRHGSSHRPAVIHQKCWYSQLPYQTLSKYGQCRKHAQHQSSSARLAVCPVCTFGDIACRPTSISSYESLSTNMQHNLQGPISKIMKCPSCKGK